MTVIIFYVSFSYLGQGSGFGAGFARLLKEAPEGYLGLTGDIANPWFVFSYFVNVFLGYNVSWALVQRYHSVPDERGAKKMALLCALLSLVGPLLWILPVMASRIIFPDINALWPSLAVPAEASFVSLALMLLPHGMIGFVVSAILSATLGQANDAFNWLAATLTRDMYVPLCEWRGKERPSEKRQLTFARLTMLFVGVCGIVVALYIPKLGGAFAFALEFYSLTAAFMMPVALGMLFLRTPWWSGIASCSAAIVVALTLMAFGVWSDQAFVRNMLSESVAAGVVFFGSAYWFRDEDPRHKELQRFRQDLRTPVLVDTVGFDPSGFHVYGLLGKICIVLGVVLVLCMVTLTSARASVAINGVAGAFLLILGGGLMLLSRRT